MAAPSPSDIVENLNPLNPAFIHPLPVLPLPASFLIDFGDFFALPGDTGQASMVAPSYEPSQH